VETVFGTGDDKPRLSIVLKPYTARDLFLKVEEEHDYDLAYVPFDYKDDWFPFALAGLLDPTAAGRDGRNFLQYLTKDSTPTAEDIRLGQLLNEIKAHRDFAGQLVPRAHEIHALFDKQMPFIPLWQLDRHSVVSTAVKIQLDDYGPETTRPDDAVQRRRPVGVEVAGRGN
jgi:hypothetical protein